MAYVLRRDVVGWRVAAFTSYDGHCYRLESGERVSKEEAWIADPDNVRRLMSGVKTLGQPEELTLAEYQAPALLQALESGGWQMDGEWRVRRRLGIPITCMRANHIMSLFLVHLSWCKAQGKDPEHGPLNVVWLPQAKLPALLLPDRQLGVGATDEDLQVVEGNGGEVREIVDQGGRRQMLIGWGDWSAYPKAYQEVEGVAVATLFCQRFMKEAKPMAAETVEQYLGPNRFLTPEGTVLQKGNFLALSIDGFLEQKGETK